MSTTGIQDQPKIFHNKKFSSFHGRNNSDELDVFEAAKYFSGYNEPHHHNVTNPNYTQKTIRGGGGGRISIDVPAPLMNMRKSLPQEQQEKEKKYKHQPSSPGGKLASFLTSLFNQTGSKNNNNNKKKKSKSTTQSMKDHHHEDDDDDDQSPNSVRRRRRSSISHFRSSNSTSADTKSMYSSSSSGFRTPPPGYMAKTPPIKTTAYKDLRSKKLPTIGKLINHDYNHHHHQNKKKIINKDLYENKVVKVSHGCAEKKEVLKKLNDDDDDDNDGGESDSSSDLFELENYDLGFYSSSGLPVYETTHMDTIKRSAQPITTGVL